jgi:hypothetical protein
MKSFSFLNTLMRAPRMKWAVMEDKDEGEKCLRRRWNMKNVKVMIMQTKFC